MKQKGDDQKNVLTCPGAHMAPPYRESSEAERKLVTYPQPLGKEEVEARFEPKQV